MAVTEAPKRTDSDSTYSDSSFQPDPGEALIEEARQRARARRRRNRGVGIILSIAAVAAIATAAAVMGSGPSPVDRPVLDSPAGAGAPVADPPVSDATLVASWGVIHEGWVLVYGDGRVIRYPDYTGGGPADGMSGYAIIVERRLTPAGLERVRSGALVVSQLTWATLVEDDVWAEAEWRPYVPAVYAVCHPGDWTLPYRWADASSVFAELPPEARTIVRDRQRRYTAVSFAPAFEPSELQGPVGCFALTTGEADRLVEVSYRPDLGRYRAGAEGVGLRFVGEQRVVEMWIQPVMPHGEFVLWGG